MPGRRMTSTPMNPMTTASVRRQPTCSPRKGTERAVTSSGVTARMAWASASGMTWNAISTRFISTMRSAARRSCRPGTREWSRCKGRFLARIRKATGTAITWRSQRTSGVG